MINKLKKKIIILSIISVFILMTLLVTIMNAVNYSAVVRDVDEVLQMLTTINTPTISDQSPQSASEISPKNNFIPHDMSPEVQYESRFFSVTISNDGNIIESDMSHIVSVTDNSISQYISRAIKSHSEKGFVNQFRYLKETQSNSTTKIVFLDCGRKLDAFKSFLWTSLIVGLSGFILVSVALFFISGKIVAPMAESYEKQKRFISDAGHEIKTPLTIISANVDLLELDGEREELHDIRTQTNRLTELTNQLVMLSKMSEPDFSTQKIPIPMSDIVYESIGSFNVLASSCNIRINMDIEPGISITGAPASIRQLVSILMDNAIKYSPKDSTINCRLYTKKKSVYLQITNQSVYHLNPADLQHVFDRFYRTDSSRNSTTGGHGIGLSIAKVIVDSHGGIINATTSSGNDFTITASFNM